MKFFKKLLSGVMALTMAASMAFSAAVQAGAETQKDGSHEYEVKWTSYDYGYKLYELSFGPFDSKEIDALKKEAAKYEYGKSGYITLYLYLEDLETGTYYEINWGLDKTVNLKKPIDCEDEEIYYNVRNNGVGPTEDDWDEILGAGMSISKSDNKTYFNMCFSIEDRFVKYLKDCDLAGWQIVAVDEKGNMKPVSIGNDKTDFMYYADYTVEEVSKDGKVKTIKKIKADDMVESEANDISKLSFSKISDQSYTGKECKPSVTVKDGKTKLTEGKDYTLSYKNNKNIGTATVTVKGKGDYTGEKTISFNIVPKKTTLKVSKKSETKAAFSWTAVKGAEKYEIYYSKDGGNTYNKLTTVSGKTSYTNSRLDFKKYDYKFKIRSYGTSSSKKYYSSYSKVVTVK